MKQSPNNTSTNEQKDGSFCIQCDITPVSPPKLDSIRNAAERGETDAQFILAEFYYKCYEESGGEVYLNEAVSWYQEAAGHGDPRAQFEIGWCYHEGRGVEEDLEKAVSWYKISAEQGYSEAQYWLGWCCQHGKGVEEDMEEAVKWFRAAAKQGCGDAIDDLRDLDCDVTEYETIMLVGR